MKERICYHPVNRNHFGMFAFIDLCSGFFKGKREKLSASFLDRFRPLNFQQLPAAEWEEVISSLFQPLFEPSEARSLAARMVSKFHMDLQAKLVSITLFTFCNVHLVA